MYNLNNMNDIDIVRNNLNIEVFVAINMIQDCVPIIEGIFKSYEEAEKKTKDSKAVIHGPFTLNIKENKIPMMGKNGIITNYKTELSL